MKRGRLVDLVARLTKEPEVATTTVYTRPSNKRYLGNTNTKEVHDIHNEQTQCQIDEILAAGHAVVFTPDTPSQARADGYDNGHYCLGGSTR